MTVKDIDVGEKRVLVRVDFNVPLGKTGEIIDDSRIRAALPTIHYLIEKSAKIILLSHLGRPKGRIVPELRLGIVARRLSQILGRPVEMASDCVGPEVEKSAADLKPGDILLLENLRFHSGEESDDTSFAQALARLGEIFVNDAFGTAHRAHASTVGITRHLPGVAGFLMEKELRHLGGILQNPAHPFALLLGGAKIHDKVGMIDNIMGKVDALLIGGAMAATFLRAKSCEVGLSLLETDMLPTASRLMEKAAAKLLLPVDVVVAAEIDNEAKTEVVPVDNIPKDRKIVDIGPETINRFGQKMRNCRTVFWNGPMGVYELPRFAAGTREMARLLAGLEATTILGGGSTADIVNEMKLTAKMTFVSTGGGALIEFLGGEKLPGVAALLNKAS